jgi:hypothetical protein
VGRGRSLLIRGDSHTQRPPTSLGGGSVMNFPRVWQKGCSLATNHTLIELEAGVEVLGYRVMVAAEL